MKLARAILIVCGISLVALLALSARRRVRPDEHERYTSAIRRLRALDARVNDGVFRKRTGITLSFDPLAEMMREMPAIHAELRAVPGFLDGTARERVLGAVLESARLQRERQRNVERFEAEDAALGASVNILAPETTTLAARVEGSGGRVLAEYLRTMRVELLEMEVSRQLGHRAEIEGVIAALRTESARWPTEQDRRAADRLVAHVQRVMEKRTRVADLLHEVVTWDRTMESARRIDDLYLHGYEAARVTEGRVEKASFALALAMLAAASAYVIFRLRASAAEVGAASLQLSSALHLLQEERKKEKELADLKTRFVAMTSHEFRTPLSVIRSSAELLQRYGDRWEAEKRGEHLTRIGRAVGGMTVMLERILLIGKTDAGMLEFRPCTLALDRLLLEIAGGIEMADSGRRHIESDVAVEVGDARADEKLVRHVLENLLSNAVKYSPEGASVRFTARREGEEVVLVVADHGIGIPEADKPRLFDNFHRAGNALHISGTGLGLSVVKRAVELHGGSIDFTSVAGVGTTFTVRIRAEREES